MDRQRLTQHPNPASRRSCSTNSHQCGALGYFPTHYRTPPPLSQAAVRALDVSPMSRNRVQMMNVQVTILQSPRNVQNKDKSLFPFLVHRHTIRIRLVVEQQELESGSA